MNSSNEPCNLLDTHASNSDAPKGTNTMNDNELRNSLMSDWDELAPILRTSKVSERVLVAMQSRIVRLTQERNAFDAGDLNMLVEDLWADYVIARSVLQNEAGRDLSTRLDGILARARGVRDELRRDAVNGPAPSRAAYSTHRRSAGFPWC